MINVMTVCIMLEYECEQSVSACCWVHEELKFYFILSQAAHAT